MTRTEAAFMTTECNQSSFEFHPLNQRKVIAKFDGGNITSDAGVLLLREVEKRSGLICGLARCFTDYRDARWVEHSVEELLGQRLFGICLGYEDLNDHDQLGSSLNLVFGSSVFLPKGLLTAAGAVVTVGKPQHVSSLGAYPSSLWKSSRK